MTFTTRPELSGTFGMVASTHWLASGAGMSVLERGGNAFDAAVAAGFVLQVVEPHLNGPGGDLPVVAWSAARGEPFVVCGQGVAPARGGRRRCCATSWGSTSSRAPGCSPACVPGSFDAWLLMLLEHGTLRLGEVLEYAIGYAETGFPALARIVDDDRGRRGAVPRRVDDLGRRCGCPRRRPASWMRNPPLAAHLRADRGRGGGRHRRPRRPDRARAQRLARGLGGRGDRVVLRLAGGARRVGPPPRRAAHRGRSGGLARDGRGAGDATTTAA